MTDALLKNFAGQLLDREGNIINDGAQDATNPRAITVAEFFALAVNDPDIRDRGMMLRQHVQRVSHTVPELIELQDVDMPAAALQALVLTHINGTADLPEQQVIVEYLRRNNHLVIPGALGMSPSANVQGRSTTVPLLRERYLKAQTLTYAQIVAKITENHSTEKVRTDVAALVLPANEGRKTDWLEPAWFLLADGTLDDPARAASVFAMFSNRLQFNCDLRDFGFLLLDTATTRDSDWATARTLPKSRLRMQLQAYTHQCIAALNYVAVGSYGLTAWARAYGLSAGLLPAVGTRSVAEYMFDVRDPSNAAIQAVTAYQRNFERNMPTVCLNIIAMFGLLHLNKDHTYKPDDNAMERIGKSYMNTLRTGVESNIVEEMSKHTESVLRTCAHPFGLAQTYWLSQIMDRHNLLMAPLAIRANVCPPPVQRLMIVDATASEWNGLPMGRNISGVYKPELDTIKAEIARIRLSPPAFSSLYHLYGVNEQDHANELSTGAVKVLIPAVYGYVNVTHVSERNERDGLALAQSLSNIERESRGLVMAWKNAWEKYLVDLDRQGLQEFVYQIAEVRTAAQPPPAQLTMGN